MNRKVLYHCVVLGDASPRHFGGFIRFELRTKNFRGELRRNGKVLLRKAQKKVDFCKMDITK